MYEYLLSIIESFIKYGVTPTALVMALIYFFRTKHFKRLANRRVPWLFKDESDVLNYQARQIRIESKLDALLSAGGVSWDADSKIGNVELMRTNGQQKKSSSQLAAFALAILAKCFTPLKVIYHSLQRRMSMRSKLLSRKLWMTIIGSVILVLNQQLGWSLSADSLIGIGSLFMSFILGQSVVDTNGVGQFAPLIQKLKSSKLWVSLIGSILIILNDEYQWGMTADNIYVIVGIAVSFILGKSAVSVVQASKNAGGQNEEFKTNTEHFE